MFAFLRPVWTSLTILLMLALSLDTIALCIPSGTVFMRSVTLTLRELNVTLTSKLHGPQHLIE